MADKAEDQIDSKADDSMEQTDSKEQNTDNAVEGSDDGKEDGDVSKAESTKEKAEVKDDKKEEDDEEESEDEEPKMGLLEQPIVLEEGRKRERKKVERMTFQSPDTEKEKVSIKQGKGKALGDIPIIEHRLNRVKAEDAKPLHRVLFRRVGSAQEVKKNIRKFSGFTFDKGEPEYEKRMQILKSKNFTKTMISNICETLDVPRSGSKEEVTERLMDWLMKPEDSGKKVPTKRKASTPRGKKGAAKGKGKAKQTKKKTKSSDDDDDDDDDSDDDSSDDSSDDDSSSDSEAEEPAKKKKKPAEKKEKKPKEKKEPVKKAETKKKAPAKKKVSEEEVSDISSDSDDDKPIMKSKAKGPPTNDELKEVIKKMLDSANLEEVTMKSVLKEIYAKYPDHDLGDRKEFVKNTVKQIIS